MPRVNKFTAVLLAFLLSATLLSGCSIYQPDLRQGNFICQEDLDRLKPDMTKHQVQQIMGSPAMTPYFKQDQWNYTYAYVDGRHRDEPLKFKTISLFFVNGKLNSYSSNYWHPSNLPANRGR
jgi:outer membrane protein assembly factor BamE